MTVRTTLSSGLITLLACASARSELPQLKYGFEANRQYGYNITIKIETENYTETQTGYSLFRVNSATGDEFRLVHEGFLDPERQVKPGTDSIDSGAVQRKTPPRSLVIDRSGRLVQSDELTPLDHVLGFLETLVLERLPTKPEDEWYSEDEFQMVESRFFGFRSPAGPSRPGTERSDYRITEVKDDLVRVEKKYQMRTGEVASNASHAAMNGTGWFLFNQREGAISSLSMNYRLVIKDTRNARTVTATVESRVMAPARLKQLLDEMERARKQLTGEAYADGPQKPLELAERTQLLRDMQSRDPQVLEAAITRLIVSKRDDRASDFSVLLADILKQAKFVLKAKAAHALVVWATPESQAALVEATNDITFIAGSPQQAGFPVAEAAYRALGTIGTESAARAIAEKIDEPTKTPVEVLKRMGPVAELPMLELMAGADLFKQRAACEVLAEIGGLRSVPALQQASEKGNARSQAKTALESLARRERLTIEELLDKARSAAPATVRETIPTLSGDFRTWSDSTGKFRIEAVMLSAANNTVKLKTRDGKSIDVPLDRLSQPDQELVAKLSQGKPPETPAHALASPSLPSSRQPARKPADELVGGTGGVEFREVSTDGIPVVGVRFQTGNWGGKSALASVAPIYDRIAVPRPDQLESIVAREGYALGAIQVDADDLVRAVRFAFMRIDGDRLNTSDVYSTDWVGRPAGNAPVTLSGQGKPVVGFHGRKGAVIDAIGILVGAK